MVNFGNDWDNVLVGEFEKPYYLALREFLKKEYFNYTVYPPMQEIFSALKVTPYGKVKAVILGQDPYHNPGQAHGMCFSVKPGVPAPPSLVNIYKEIDACIYNAAPIAASTAAQPARQAVQGGLFDISAGEEAAGNMAEKEAARPVRPERKDGYLMPWAEQGVLLLNTVLTVRANSPMSHRGQGWETFTDKVIEKLNERTEPIIFLLWGAPARKKAALIDRNRHHVLEAAHPSPLSAHNGFFGCAHFKRANDILIRAGQEPIVW